MQIGIKESTLRMRVTVSNPAASTARVAILCRAEFACGARARQRCSIGIDRHSAEPEDLWSDGMADGEVRFAGGDLLQQEGRNRRGATGGAQQEWTLACEAPGATASGIRSSG